MSSAGTTTFTGTRLQTMELLNSIQSVSSGIVNFNGTVAPVLNSTAPPLFANVNINNTAGVTASLGWSVYGGFKVGTGATFYGSTFTHNFYGSVTNQGAINSSGSGTLNFAPATATTLVLGSGSAFAAGGVVAFSGNQAITLSSGALSLGSVLIANTHATGITPVSNWTLANGLQIAGGATFHAGAGLARQLAGTFNNGGTFDGGTSLVQINGPAQTVGGGSTTFYSLLVSSTLTCGSALSVSGNFTNNGTFDGTAGELSFTGSSPSVIGGSTTPVISATTATQNQAYAGTVDVKNGAASTVQGTVNFTVAASDAASGLDGPPGLVLSQGATTVAATYVNESPAGTFHLGGDRRHRCRRLDGHFHGHASLRQSADRGLHADGGYSAGDRPSGTRGLRGHGHDPGAHARRDVRGHRRQQQQDMERGAGQMPQARRSITPSPGFRRAPLTSAPRPRGVCGASWQ